MGGGSSGGIDCVGRPRKYGAHMALALTPASMSASPGSLTPTPKKNRGGLLVVSDVGEWMSSTSAGLAFTPHIIHVAVGELLSFAQQRPRALCILSGNGAVSAVTLGQFTSSGGTVAYEGRFEILCLSGSYLLPDSGTLSTRTGGLSISVCCSNGHVIGGRLIASSLVQVVVCSFVYGNNNSKTKTEDEIPSREEKSPGVELNESSEHAVAWPPDPRSEMRNSLPY